MKRPLLRGALCAATTLLPAAALAQTPGTETAFDVQTFWPTAGPSEHLVSRGSTVSPSGSVGFTLLAGFMRQPLVLTPRNATAARNGVDWAITSDFLWSVGILRRFQLSAAIPVVIAQSGEGSTPVLGTAGAVLGDTALRDLRVEASWAILQRARLADATGFGLRLDLGAAIPFGDEKGFNSQGAFTFAPMLAADLRTRYLTFTVNGGARLREARRFADIVVGHTLVASGGLAFRPSPASRFKLSAEYFGTFGLASAEGFRSPVTHEVFVSARHATDAAQDVEIILGGAVGLSRDALTPGWRAVVGLSYAPRGNDTDGDRVVDADDRCLTQPEDRDEYEDEDGCPDNDNDSDSVPDSADRCVNEPEDADNFQDEDGCPDDDNDGDAVSDADDECPLQAAGDHPDTGRNGCPIPDTDSDGVLDPDDRCVDVAAGSRPDPQRAGCPIPDTDGDGVPDDADACPNAAAGERPDRWRRGCADPDSDRDGVMGDNDRCPAEAETVNGVTDDDGCADTGPELVTWDAAGETLRFARPVVVPPRVQVLPPTVLPLVRQAAQRVRARGNEVARVILEVMPGPGAPAQAEAQRQAEVVRDVFIGARIPQRLMTAQAATRPARPVPGRPLVVGSLTVRIERRPAPADEAQSTAPQTQAPATAAPAPAAAPAAAPATP